MSSGWAFSLYNKFASWYQCFSLSKRHYLAVSKMKSTLNFKTRIVIFFHVSIWQIPQYNYNIIKPYYFGESIKLKTQLENPPCLLQLTKQRSHGVWKTTLELPTKRFENFVFLFCFFFPFCDYEINDTVWKKKKKMKKLRALTVPSERTIANNRFQEKLRFICFFFIIFFPAYSAYIYKF